jgi:cytoskeleton-associated protein 5
MGTQRRDPLNSFFFSFSSLQCLWRINRFLPQNISKVNLDRILLDIHNFKKMLSKEKQQRPPNDMTQRTLKTLLHTLCRLTGPEVSELTALIHSPTGSSPLHLKLITLLAPK